MLEPTVERLGDGIEVAIGERTHRLDAALDPKDFLVDAQHGLQMTVLVGDLRREQKLQLVLRCCQQEGSEEPRDVELGTGTAIVTELRGGTAVRPTSSTNTWQPKLTRLASS